MRPMMIPRQAVEIVRRWEGLKLKAYKDVVGIVTIGYGTTAAAGVGITPRLGMTITQAEAEWYLERALVKFAEKIRPAITAPINDNQWSALLSLAYNIGPTAFKRSSALRHFNAGNTDKAARSILLWNKAGGKVVKGLVNRRKDEQKLFLTPVEEPTPEPEPTLTLWQIILSLFGGGQKWPNQ